MDIFKQRKILITALIFTGILNIILIGFNLALLKNNSNHPQNAPKDPDRIQIAQLLKEKLGLTSSQTIAFQNIRDSFFEHEESISTITKNCRDSMNSQMYSHKANDSLLKQLAETIAGNELKMEIMRIEQARQIRSICNNEQLDKFEKLVREIRDYLKPDDKKNK